MINLASALCKNRLIQGPEIPFVYLSGRFLFYRIEWPRQSYCYTYFSMIILIRPPHQPTS